MQIYAFAFRTSSKVASRTMVSLIYAHFLEGSLSLSNSLGPEMFEGSDVDVGVEEDNESVLVVSPLVIAVGRAVYAT